MKKKYIYIWKFEKIKRNQGKQGSSQERNRKARVPLSNHIALFGN